MIKQQEDRKIAELQANIQDLEQQLKAHTKYEVSQKIYVEDDYLSTLIDLIQQLREVELPNGRPLLKSDHHSPYYKIGSEILQPRRQGNPIVYATISWIRMRPR